MNRTEQENIISDDNSTSMMGTYVYITLFFPLYMFSQYFAVYSLSNHLTKKNLPNRFMKQTCNHLSIMSLMDRTSHLIL